MTSPTFTNRRIVRDVAVLQAFQTAQGSEVSNFSTGATRVLWAQEVTFDPRIVKGDFQGTHGSTRHREEGRYFDEQHPILRIRMDATPYNIEWILRSFAGPWSGGSPETLTVQTAMSEFCTFAFVERVQADSMYFLRFYDCWAHRVLIHLKPGTSILEMIVDIAARDFDRTPMASLGGIVLPASFQQPNVVNFATHFARLYQSPSGANVSISMRELRIVLETGISHECWNDHAPIPIKEGFTGFDIFIRSTWMDETYGVVLPSEAQVPVFKEFLASFANGAHAFSLDFKNVDFTSAPTGYNEGGFLEFITQGSAYLDGSLNDTTISLTL
jgi:hypothetical protein